MKNARGKAQHLLQPLLEGSPVAPLLEDHLLVGVVLSKGIDWNQVRPEETQSWLLYQLSPMLINKQVKEIRIMPLFKNTDRLFN